MTNPDRTGTAILLSLLALVLFDLMGLIIKHLSVSYSAAELSAWRNLFGLVPAFVALWSARAWRQGVRNWHIAQWPLACARGFIVTFAQFLFYLSLGHMAFATASTITYANALFMTALAVPLLGEKVGWVRWSAVLLGFAGVMLVMGPGRETFAPIALAPLGAAFLYALAGVTARRIDASHSTALVNLYSAGVALVTATALALVMGGFSAINSWEDFGWIMTMGGLGGTAVLCLVASYRMTEQSNLAPFSYFGIPIAFVMGWITFDEAPFQDLFPGALLIAAGGLMVIWRERRLNRHSA
ncbi:DMT family transporter [Aliisedimentitalea scapharcae]|uniref:DMT family transporter n=1 Tax=Aliisedimentitalea scapharcae TaxID=1524259 RepID=A0ABZ2XRQ0_9RHOB